MAITLNPTVDDLGITAPVLGPWFSDSAVNLGAIDAANKLGLSVSFTSATKWFAPATGTLSLYVTDPASPPAALDTLQDSGGGWPFLGGRVVAFFRLLPEVQARLHALVGLIPAATSNPITTLPTAAVAPTRPEVRSFAMVLPASVTPTVSSILPLVGGANFMPTATDAERMLALGLAIQGANVVNGAIPMTWLRRPGGAATDRDLLLQGLTGSVDLWAFDRRGRAIDPGAVACWWSWLLNSAVGPATGDPQLLAPDIAASDYPQVSGRPVVVQVAAGRTAHLVDPHEGPLGDPFLGKRLQSAGATAASNLVSVSGTTSVSLTFSALPAAGTPAPPADNPQLDDAPRARMAVLPVGAYGSTATLWPGGAVHADLTRDFVRVAVVEEESHLVGLVRRDSRTTPATPADRLRSAQNRPSTRIAVGRTASTDGVLLANGALVAEAMLALPNTTEPTRFVLGVADVAWGATASQPASGGGPLPTALTDSGEDTVPSEREYRVRALTGGGSAAEDHQVVLVEVDLGIDNAGAWVRAWPQGFNLDTGVHFHLTGGAGRADSNGVARLTMVLPAGKIDAEGLLGMEILTLHVDANGAVVARRSHADRRFSRPAPLGGSLANGLGLVSGVQWVSCETGVTGFAAVPAGTVPPGGHLVLLTDPPTLVDRTTVPAAALSASTLRNKLQATDVVSLMVPAFASTPDRADASGRPLSRTPTVGGDPSGGIEAIVGDRLHRLDRTAPTSAIATSMPFALLDRLEVAGATTAATSAQAAIGASPPVPWSLEPRGSFFLGHPGVAACIETHGAGASITGAPAVAVAEYVRERTAGLGFSDVRTLAEPVRSAAIQSEIALAAEAATALPTIADGTGAGPVVAVLRTVATGVEGVTGVAQAAIDSNTFPLAQDVSKLVAWLDGQISVGGGAGTALRNQVSGPTDSIVRALDRRLMTQAFGAREAMTALMAAFERAQDFVYLETPALDNLVVDAEAANVQLWQRLIARMDSRRGLRVIACVPTLLAPGTPRKLQEVRDHGLMDAITAMRAAAADRFAVFSPGAFAGRALRLASTSVIVDDAFALVGSTHLWRRGLTWDSSLAASVFDERVIDGRPQDVRAFRIQLLADRLGIPSSRLPDDPAELVKAIRLLDARGSERLSASPIVAPTPAPLNADLDIWNPDGTQTGLSLTGIATLFASVTSLTDVDHAIVEG